MVLVRIRSRFSSAISIGTSRLNLSTTCPAESFTSATIETRRRWRFSPGTGLAVKALAGNSKARACSTPAAVGRNWYTAL